MIGVDTSGNLKSKGPPGQKIDWDKVKASASFFIFRGSYSSYADRLCEEEWVKASRSGPSVLGMYMFLKWPKKGVKPPTPTQQAQAFVKAAGNAGGLGRGDLFALDVEFPGGRKETRMSPASCVEWVLEAATTLKLAYGCWPILYTSDRVYKEDLLSVDVGELVNCPLWLARYPFKLGQRFKSGPPAGRKPPVPRPWKGAYWIWQFQGNATNFPGCSGFVDMNDFNPYMGAKGDPREAWAKARLGAKTTVKAYQLSRGLKADGVAGPKTFAHLMWEPPARI